MYGTTAKILRVNLSDSTWGIETLSELILQYPCDTETCLDGIANLAPRNAGVGTKCEYLVERLRAADQRPFVFSADHFNRRMVDISSRGDGHPPRTERTRCSTAPGGDHHRAAALIDEGAISVW